MARMTLEEALAASLVREEPDAIQDEVLEEIPEKEPDPMEQMLLAVGEPPEEITEPVERCIIDGWTRKITVPNLYAFIGIESDEKTMRIPFRCPRIVGNGTDLSKMHIYVNYQNANGEKNRYLAEDVMIDGDDILFSWELSRHVTMYKGFVSYIICAKKGDTEGNTTNEWNTHVAQGTVDEGFEVIDPAEIEEHDFDIIEQLLLMYDRKMDLPAIGDPGQLLAIKSTDSSGRPTELEAVDPPQVESGLSFDSGYQDDAGYIHLTKEDNDIEGFTPFKVAGGGGEGGGSGGGGSRIVFACYTAPSFSVMKESGTAPIRFKFTSVDAETGVSTGDGNVSISVNGTMRANMAISQGDVTVDPFKYLSEGANTVKLVITDAYGTTAPRSFTITIESFDITWSLGDVRKNTEDDLSFYITPTGSGAKTIYTKVDGNPYATDSVTTSGNRLTKTVAGLTHGAHMIEVYGVMDVGGSELESKHLTCAVAQVKGTSPVVAVKWPESGLAQYTPVQIHYMAIDPANNPSEVQLIVNGTPVATDQKDQSEQIWSYRPALSGTVTLGIKCGTTMAQKTFQIAAIGADIAEVTDSLTVKVDPSMITDLSGWRYGDYSFTLSENFDFVNGGLQEDESGVHCIRITAGDRLTLNYPLFSGDARKTGKAAKVIYKVKDSSNKEAEAISCMSGSIGLLAKANNVYLSGDQTSIKMSVCEDEKTELDINIQRDSEDRLVSMWESCSTFSYNQYAEGESYTQTEPQGITFGSDDADVILYLFRAYSRDLTDNEIKANYIFDGATGEEIIERNDRNAIYDSAGKINIETAAAKCPNAHFLIVDADRMTTGKKDAVYGNLRHIYVAGGAEHRFSAPVKMVVQGTSSVEHAETAGPNLKFTLTEGITLEDGTHKDGYAMYGEEKSIPITILNYKKNIASEDHIVNMMCQEWYNRYQPTIRQERVDDPRVRDCMQASMCVVFFHNTGSTATKVGPDIVQPDETIFFGLGNLCTDKDAVEAYQYEPIVQEVLNNTEPQVRFKSDDLSGENFTNNFEYRYLDGDLYTEEQAKAMWQEVQTFVHECDYTQATNTALEKVTSFNGQAFSVDSPEYRKAKWKAEAPEHFDMAGLYWHYNDTLFHLLRDNRAKNTFWSYRPDTGKWSLKFNWDNDTGHCRNNEGYIDIEPGYLDFDTIGTADVYNAADNAVFTNLRECNFDELRENYLDRESAGAWDTDAIYRYEMENQGYICEALWIEDAQHNAIRTLQNLGTSAYLERATGRLRLHLKKSLIFQKALVDSYYNANASVGDSASFRGYTPSTWTAVRPSGLVKITPYTDMFINILAGSTAYRKRAYAGQEVELDLSAALNDTEIYLRNAGWIMKIGSMAGMYLGQFEASRLKRVKELLIGSSEPGYVNTNFTTASFDNCKKLEEVNMGGLVNAKKAFDFSPNIYLRRLYTKGSGITGVTFARNGRIEEAHLNALASVSLRALRFLDTFDMESFEALTSLIVEECPSIDSYALVKTAVQLARVRILGVAWSVTSAAYDTLLRIYNAAGIDDDGYGTEHGVITGDVLFRSISRSKYDDIVEKIPTVNFTYEELLEEVTATFKNTDGTVLFTTKTERGGGVPDPVLTGLIEAPVQAPTVEEVYTFYGWDKRLDYITEDTIFTALYTRADRYYTVVRKDYDGTVIETTSVKVHGSAPYTGNDLERQGYIWTGWSAPADDVVSDMEITAAYVYPTLPTEVKDLTQYDFAYSDDIADNSAYTFGELYAIMKSGQTAYYLPVKAEIKMLLSTDVITDTALVFSLHAKGHYALADGSGRSNADWYMKGVLNANRQMNPVGTNAGGWDACPLRKWLNETLYGEIPAHWRALISLSVSLANAGSQSAQIISSDDYFRIPSHCEVGFDLTAVPYKNEIDSEAEEIAFSCYTTNESRVKKQFNGEGVAQNWWLRSADAGGSSAFRYVYLCGSGATFSAGNSYGVCVGFSC